MSSFPAQFGAPGWLLEPQLLDWAVAPQEQHAVLLKDWVHWLHAGLRAATLEQILFLVVGHGFFWDCYSALWIHWWQHVISCIYEVTTKRHDKKISWNLQITRSTLKYLKCTSNNIFGTEKPKRYACIQTFKLRTIPIFTEHQVLIYYNWISLFPPQS